MAYVHDTRHAAERWCVLRCSNTKTLELAASLADAGFDAWSPAETIQRRARRGTKPETLTVPLTPSFVFARADRVADLLDLAHSPALNYRVWDPELKRMVTRGHPYFRVFYYLGEIATVPDHQLEPLRSLERKRKPKPVTRTMAQGERIRLAEAGFEGLWGTVLTSRKNYTRVQVDGFPVPVDFPTWTLQGSCQAGSVKVNAEPAEPVSAQAA
jgi:transcription antitermination factor NusG